jgi:hypothetical protein
MIDLERCGNFRSGGVALYMLKTSDIQLRFEYDWPEC